MADKKKEKAPAEEKASSPDDRLDRIERILQSNLNIDLSEQDEAAIAAVENKDVPVRELSQAERLARLEKIIQGFGISA